MAKRSLKIALTLGFLVTGWALPPASAQVCEPEKDGHLADAFYEGTAVFWQPVVEYREMVLTIGGPCEDIVKVFGSKDQISFDLGEIERVEDGQYTWELRRVAPIDEGVQQELQAARGTGEEDAVWWSFFQQGAIPQGPYTEAGTFRVMNGEIVDPGSGEESQKSARASREASGAALAGGIASAGMEEGVSGASPEGGNFLTTKDFWIADDLIVTGSQCLGFDCINGEVFGSDTLRLKEKNLRVRFEDTSSASGYPTTDWRLVANDSAMGGRGVFFLEEASAGREVFSVEARAPSHSVYVDDGGRVGFGTSTPLSELHVVSSDTPTLRLEQDGSQGWAAQTWDVAGNESNFFVRDVTNGSKLPFKIYPGAFSNALVVAGSGDIGVGTRSPGHAVHIVRGSNPGFALEDMSALGMPEHRWDFEVNNNGLFQITRSGTGGPEVLIRARQDPGGLETMDVDGSIEADAFNLSSSRTFKTAFEPVDAREVLARVAVLPVSEWSFTWDDEGTRHIGPMAEDFLELFRVGGDASNISVGDAAGVALAAIQGLYQELQAKEREIVDLKEELGRRLAELEASVRALQD